MRFLRSVGGLVVLLGLTACSAAWRAAKAGQEALDRGDVEGAMANYASACRQSGDEDWCERADRLYLDVKVALLAEAQPLCGPRGKERQCLDVLKRARRIKDDPQLAALADAAGASWLSACRTIETPTVVDALLKVRCFEALSADINTVAYRQQVDAERLTLARLVGAQAQSARQKNLQATTNGLLSMAACFSPAGVNLGEVDVARRAVFEQLITKASLAADGLVTRQGLCADVASLTDGRMVCVDGAGEVGLRIGLGRSEMTHEWADTMHDVTYVARREVYENPEWRRLERSRVQLERNARTARQNAQLASNDCKQAEQDWYRAKYCQNCGAQRAKEQYCRHANTLDDFSRDANRDLQNVEYNQRNVPRELVNEITDVYRYTRRQHTWRQNFRISLVGAGLGFSPKDLSFTLSRTAAEQPGFEPAGVRRLVAYPPSQDELDGEALGELRAELQPWLKGALEQSARAKEVTCPKASESADAAFECQTAVAFLRGVDPSRFFMDSVGRAADAKAKYPAAPCAK